MNEKQTSRIAALKGVLAGFEDGGVFSPSSHRNMDKNEKVAKELLAEIAFEFNSNSIASFGLVLRLFKECNALNLLMKSAKNDGDLADFVESRLLDMLKTFRESGRDISREENIEDQVFLAVEMWKRVHQIYDIKRANKPWRATKALISRVVPLVLLLDGG